MSSEFDPQADFALVADQLEVVTLRRADGSAAAAIGAALRLAVATHEAAASDGRYTANDVRWHLPAAELAAPPRLGDRIVDAAAGCWTILETRLQTCGSRWECVTRNLALTGGLTSFVTILREVAVKGASGAVEPTYVPLASAVAARIQELSSRRHEEHGRQSGIVEAKIYLAEQITVDNGCRVQAADGTLYEITGYEQPDSITSLFTINAIRRI
jgi:head-tail adaptor